VRRQAFGRRRFFLKKNGASAGRRQQTALPVHNIFWRTSMRKKLWLFVTILAAFAFAGCGGGEEEEFPEFDGWENGGQATVKKMEINRDITGIDYLFSDGSNGNPTLYDLVEEYKPCFFVFESSAATIPYGKVYEKTRPHATEECFRFNFVSDSDSFIDSYDADFRTSWDYTQGWVKNTDRAYCVFDIRKLQTYHYLESGLYNTGGDIDKIQGGFVFQTYDPEEFYLKDKRMIGDYNLYYTIQDIAEMPQGAKAISWEDDNGVAHVVGYNVKNLPIDIIGKK
jgi:hypothetical protein